MRREVGSASLRPSSPARTAAHEAGHVVASFLLDIPVEKVEIDGDGHGLTKTANRKLVDGEPSDVFNAAIVSLAGGAYERSLGLKAHGDNGDFAKAAVLIRESFESKAASRQGFDIVLEATHQLVSSDRFQMLGARLTPVLAEKSWHWGPDVLRFLRENDPERPSERHSVGPVVAPWYEVTDRDKRLLYRGADQAEAKRVQRLHPHSLKVGSIYS